MNQGKLETLVIARAFTTKDPLTATALAKMLQRFAPPHLTEGEWRAEVEAALGALRASDVLDERNQLRDRQELARRIGNHNIKQWKPLADRFLPALALDIAPDDDAGHKQLADRDRWSAAIVARAIGMWITGKPPSPSAVGDAVVWRGLGLPGKPKRCPGEVRAHVLQRELATEPGPPDRLLRLLAAKLVGSPRPDLRTLRDGLVRNWLRDRLLSVPAQHVDAPTPRVAELAPRTAEPALGAEKPHAAPPDFAQEVRAAALAARDGVFGDRKVFISAVWNALRHQRVWSTLSLDDFKTRLVSAHRAGALSLTRADLVAAMDPALVAASETITDGASFHFIMREARS